MANPQGYLGTLTCMSYCGAVIARAANREGSGLMYAQELNSHYHDLFQGRICKDGYRWL